MNTLLFGWWLFAVAVLLASSALALAQPSVRRRGLAAATPPVSIVIPVKGTEPSFTPALESVLRQTRPGDEVIVASAEADGPLLAEATACFARFPHVSARLHVGAVAEIRSPKMNNMLGPIRAAANDMILSKDANAMLAPGQLELLLRHLAPGVGLVTVVTRADGPANMPARIEAAFMNAYHARLLLAASTLGLGFGLGKVMLFRRSAFDSAGGARAMADALHEDHAMGMVFARAGLRTVIAGQEVSQLLATRSLGAVWQRQLRWAICRRFDAPAAFLAEPLFTGLTAALLALALPPEDASWAARFAAAGLTLAGWYGVETLFLVAKGWRPVSPLAFLAREGMNMALWLRAWTTTQVVWAGEAMDARRGQAGRGARA